MTYEDLKPGYVLEMSDGVLCMLMYTADGTLIGVSKQDVWFSVRNNRDDFNEDIKPREFHIVAVYGYSQWAYKSLWVSVESRPLLWKRLPTIEVTMAEIEEKFGAKVKIVDEK